MRISKKPGSRLCSCVKFWRLINGYFPRESEVEKSLWQFFSALSPKNMRFSTESRQGITSSNSYGMK